MKLYLIVLHVIACLALTDSTLGDGDGKATPPRVCTVKEEEDIPVFATLGVMALNCIATDGTGIEELKESKSLEERKVFFKNICDKRQLIRECLRGVGEQSEVCQDQTQDAIFKTFRELLETTLDSACVEDGEVVATMVAMYENSSSDPFTSDPFHSCVAAGIGKLTMAGSRDLQTGFFLLYREAINVKECFGRITHEEDLIVSSKMESILSDIIEQMKCIHPQDGTTVLCTTIDVTLPDTPRLCPIKSVDETKWSVFQLLFESFAWCYQSGFYHGGDKLVDIETLDMSLSLMKQQCVNKRTVGHCWSDVVAFSSVCLNEAQHNVVKIFENSLQNAMDYSCIADGKYVGYVLFKVLSDMKETQNRKIITDCVAIAEQIHPTTDTQFDATRVLIYHQQLKVFKGCFMNKLRGDNRAVFNAETFLTLVQKSMKCIDPEHGTMVLCETMDPTPSTGIKVCPFVGEHEDEPPKSEMFLDMGFDCIKASTIDFDRLERFTTLEEFQTFFNSFCHNRLAVKHCVDDVSSNSVVCQNQTNHQRLTIFTDFYETVLETGCEHDGEALATIMHGLTNDDERGIESDLVEVCLDTADNKMKTARLSDVSISAKSMTLYKTFESLKECILNGNYEVGFKNVFAKLVNVVLRRLKCIHPDDGTLVLCETIVNN